MLLKTFNPITPSNRHRSITIRSNLWKGKSINKLTVGLSKKSGRNNLGRITVFTKGGGHNQSYRKIDFKRSLINISAIIIRIEYDPNRSCFISLIAYKNGVLSYIIAPKNMKEGDVILSGLNVESKIGYCCALRNILVGTAIHNIELIPGRGGQIARAAGNFALLISKRKDGYCLLRLKSGELRLVSSLCFATIGIVSNIENMNVIHGKAGHSRWKNKRPSVRGVAMNPVDHPHGGRTKGGRPSVTPWGLPTKGRRTQRKINKLIIKKRYN
uniref:Large ribosomal subunit protein uL2m n=1 Tax=Malawimonas californiana TaxID=221722 RepID=A0A0B5GSD3_MALCL|nr:ribosomal protein L2 [Malawimonas californiana]AJF22860.1 ribosomal protein L2 [Malawimonas californiana]